MKLYIKYMVTIRCKMIVKEELIKLGIEYNSIDLGVVDTKHAISEETRQLFNEALKVTGLELLEDKKAILVDQINTLIIELVHYTDQMPNLKYSAYISQKLNYNYTYLANLFSEVKGITIENFIIMHKIERVKELLIYDELNLTEISYLLEYSSVAHLSKQFKNMTGLTPTFFKNLKIKKRNMPGDT
jgi:AraC-like DNA-binding protein